MPACNALLSVTAMHSTRWMLRATPAAADIPNAGSDMADIQLDSSAAEPTPADASAVSGPVPTPPDALRWYSSPKTLLRYVLSLDDSPHHIALGTAIGMFLGLTPTVGIQMFLVIITYYICLILFRFNCKAAIVTVYISNPLTMLPLYWFDYRVGRLFFGGDVTKSQLAAVLKYDGFSQWWSAITTLFVDMGWTMLVGSLIVGTIGGVVTYPIMRWLLTRFRSGDGSQAAPPHDQQLVTAEDRAVA